MKNLVIERLRDAIRDAYPPGRTTVRTVDLAWLLAQVEGATAARPAPQDPAT